MKNLFWNAGEKRLRTFWRLVIFLILLAGLMFGFTLLVQLINTVVLLAGHQWNTAVLSNPAQNVAFGGILPLIRSINGLLTLAVILGASALAGRLLDRRSFTDFGFHFGRQWWSDLGFGLALGAVLMALIFGVEYAAGWVQITASPTNQYPEWSFTAWIFSNGFFYLCVGIYEELVSRGYLLRNLAEGLRIARVQPKTAVLIAYLISSSVFGLLHLGNPNASLISTLNLVLAGLFLGLGYALTGELGISIGLHITWNFFQGVVFGFPVSGTSSVASLIGIQQLGPDWMTGGAFGPEAGVMGLAAMAIGFGMVWLWVIRTRGKAPLREELAVYAAPQAPEGPQALEGAGGTSTQADVSVSAD
ncbi:predicted metal-dependent membrane protease [Longilinea arvoryzae]|uniref:Predicted metal-dependent membrane protease n=1 Tax=Longilinea arvoryzae TaxID=360412 RepID=A0A0S7BHK6_9CHLR|nr:type II CAAX endopeptidase family protein [Longilinea arvoryzae]GAP14083.1 predicted metal-dependent membrane protease [Longilinea arvoryzae]